MKVLYVLGKQMIKSVIFSECLINPLRSSPLNGMSDISSEFQKEMQLQLDGHKLMEETEAFFDTASTLLDYRPANPNKDNHSNQEIWDFQTDLFGQLLRDSGGLLPDTSEDNVIKIAKNGRRAIKTLDTPIPRGRNDCNLPDEKRNNPKSENKPRKQSGKNDKRPRNDSRDPNPKPAKKPRLQNAIGEYKSDDVNDFLNEFRKAKFDTARFSKFQFLGGVKGPFRGLPWGRLRLTSQQTYSADDEKIKQLKDLKSDNHFNP